eukprot:TCONS_00073280-protein
MADEIATSLKRLWIFKKRRNFIIFFCIFFFGAIFIALNFYHYKLMSEFGSTLDFNGHLYQYDNKGKIELSSTFDFTYNLLSSLKVSLLTSFKKNTKIIETPVTHLVRKSQDTGMFLHNDKGQLLCGTTTLKVLILVLSEYKELALRMDIRKTWADKHAPTAKYIRQNNQYKEFKWRKLFVISRGGEEWAGASFVETELRMQPDILEVEIQEHHTKRALKLYSALRWVLNNCNFKYIMYTTAHNFVNLPALYNFVSSDAHNERFLFAGSLAKKEIQLPSLDRSQKKYRKAEWVEYIQGRSAILSRVTLETIINDLSYLSNFRSLNQDIMVAAAAMGYGIQAQNVTNFTKKLRCKFLCCENDKKFIQNYDASEKCAKVLYRDYN